MAKERANLSLLMSGAKLTGKQKTAIKNLLKRHAHELWSLAVRGDWNWKCAVCGKGSVEAHHLIPCQWEETRYLLINGIALCSHDHQFNAELAPHQNAAGWMDWLSRNYFVRYEWLQNLIETGEYKKFDGTKNIPHYLGHIRRLKEYVEPEDFERVVGVRFAAWLEENSGG